MGGNGRQTGITHVPVQSRRVQVPLEDSGKFQRF
jgi:hypothetical protein